MNDAANIISVDGWKIPIALFVAIVGLFSALLGAIIAACVSVVVNQISNQQQTKRLVLQLDHEVAQKNRDREMALRRDVYVEVASEMAKAARFVAKFGDLNLPFSEHEAITENFGPVISKLHMVAGIEILTKIIEASDVFASINLELNLLRLSLLLDKKNTTFIQKSVEDDLAQQQNLLTRIGQLQAENPRHSEIPALATSYQELEMRIKRTRQLNSELNLRVMTGQFSLSSIVHKRTLSFAEKLIEVNIALRNELNFALKADEENYKKIVRQSQTKAVGEMEKYIADIAKVVEEKRNVLKYGEISSN